jgi:hypothetical protein
MGKSLDEVIGEISRRVKPTAPAADVAKATFDWMIDNIKYDYDRKRAIEEGRDRTYVRPPEDVLASGKGVCGDQAGLYVAICRKLGLEARFAHVTEDQNGQTCNHACALVRIKDRWVQVDPAYQEFGAQHRKYSVKGAPEPEYAGEVIDAIAQLPWFRKALLAISAAGLLITGSIAYQHGVPRKTEIVETQEGVRFFTKHGGLHYRIAPEAREQWEEALFFREKTSGALSGNELLELLIALDRDSDNSISQQEANDARLRYRLAYARKSY